MNDIWNNASSRTVKGILVVLFTMVMAAGCIGIGTLEDKPEISNLTGLDELNRMQACEVWTQDPGMVLAQLRIEPSYTNVSAIAHYCVSVNGSKW